MKQFVVTSKYFKIELNADSFRQAIFYFENCFGFGKVRFITDVTEVNVILNSIKF